MKKYYMYAALTLIKEYGSSSNRFKHKLNLKFGMLIFNRRSFKQLSFLDLFFHLYAEGYNITQENIELH
jgi:hypothetical protein